MLGSTPASTALLLYDIDEPLVRLSRKIGEANAIRAWRRSHLAVQALHARTRELGVDCDLEERDTLYLAGDLLDGRALEREAAARRRIGIEAIYLSRAALRERIGVRSGGALVSYGNLAADPRRLAIGYPARRRGQGSASPCAVRDRRCRGDEDEDHRPHQPRDAPSAAGTSSTPQDMSCPTWSPGADTRSSRPM